MHVRVGPERMGWVCQNLNPVFGIDIYGKEDKWARHWPTNNMFIVMSYIVVVKSEMFVFACIS